MAQTHSERSLRAGNAELQRQQVMLAEENAASRWPREVIVWTVSIDGLAWPVRRRSWMTSIARAVPEQLALR